MVNPIVKGARRPTARDTILDAAATLIHEIGAGHITLDAVAARAGVSKGGLLYHFPSKSALLQAMVECAVGEALAQLEPQDETEGAEAIPAGREKDIVNSLFHMRADSLCDAAKYRTAQSMLGAMVEEPKLLDPIRKLQTALWSKVKATGAPPERLWLLWLAMEGLMFSDMLQVSPLSAQERDRIVALLVRDVEAELVTPPDTASGGE